MNLEPVLKELRDELEAVKLAIAVFEQIASGTKRGRGRPPKWMKQVDEAKAEAPRRGRPPKSG